MKRLIPLLIAVIAFPLMANAQTRYTPAELDTLVSTIALYPDPLLVHVLNATTHGDDLPNAYAFANANRNLKGDDLAKSIENAELDYDESVMALIPFPDVLKKLTKYATWANQLGEAVEMQKADVMDAVQRMRKVANKNGYLKSDENVTVTVDDNISIQPVREEYVYVPEYDPRIVYYVVSDGTFRLRYANGIWIGAGLVHWAGIRLFITGFTVVRITAIRIDRSRVAMQGLGCVLDLTIRHLLRRGLRIRRQAAGVRSLLLLHEQIPLGIGILRSGIRFLRMS